MALVVGTNSWIAVSEADTYFTDRVAASDYWTATAEKSAALVTAYKWLNNSGRWNLPATATQAMKDAQCEYALYLLQHQPDLDLRMGLQSQGVVEAGIVKEKYTKQLTVPAPPIVFTLLQTYDTNEPFAIFDVERDEENYTSYDAPRNLTRDP